MAHGAIEAIESLGRHPESVFVAGSDATTQACENILSDRQDLDVYKPLTPLVEALMKVVHETLSGQRHARDHRVQHIKVGVEPVDKTSLAKFYHMDGPRCRKKEW
jgi:ABC-type xylose transport system substrate-binding protein